MQKAPRQRSLATPTNLSVDNLDGALTKSLLPSRI